MTQDNYHAEQVELALYVENEGDLYPQKKAIIENMKRKVERGEYDPKLAVKGWLHWVNAGAAKYCKEFHCEVIRTFPIAVRTAVAQDVADETYEAIKRGEYGALTKTAAKPAKPSKKSPKKAAKKPAKKAARKR
jgi:hypothetical protein